MAKEERVCLRLLDAYPEAVLSISSTSKTTCLHEAAFSGNLKLFEAVLDTIDQLQARGGIEKNGKLPSSSTSNALQYQYPSVPIEDIINHADNWGSTALHFAAGNGHLPIVQVLYERGGDLFAKKADGLTPLTLAKENEHTLTYEWIYHEMVATRKIGISKDKNRKSIYLPIFLSLPAILAFLIYHANYIDPSERIQIPVSSPYPSDQITGTGVR